MRTNIAAGRACKPSRFTTGTSLSIFWIGEESLARRLSRPICRFWLHYVDQFRIKIRRAVSSKPLQFLIHGRDFNQPRDVAAWTHGNCDVRHLQSENFVVFAVHSNALDLIDAVPFLQGHDQVESFLG